MTPKDHWDGIQPLLPEKYSPLQRDTGDGLQSVYLAELPEDLAIVLADLGRIDREATSTPDPSRSSTSAEEEQREWEDQIERQLVQNDAIPETERAALVKSRRGQGRFRDNLLAVESRCRLTGVTEQEFLIASHIKPWRLATDAERLDGHNGLLLTPNADHLFDQGFISFSDEGKLLVSPVLDRAVLSQLGLPGEEGIDVGPFDDRQKQHLQFHRAEIFRKIGS